MICVVGFDCQVTRSKSSLKVPLREKRLTLGFVRGQCHVTMFQIEFVGLFQIMLPTCRLLSSSHGIAICISTVQHSWVGLKVISLSFVMFHICVHLQGRHRSWMLGNLFTRPQAEHRSVGSHTEITEIATLRCLQSPGPAPNLLHRASDGSSCTRSYKTCMLQVVFCYITTEVRKQLQISCAKFTLEVSLDRSS